MNRNPNILSSAAATILFAASITNCAGQPVPKTGSTDARADTVKKSNAVADTAVALRYDSLTTHGITFHWATDRGLLFVKLSAPTTGWMSVGFNPTSMKKDANIIIGYVKDGAVFIQDNFGTTLIGHQSDVSLGGKDNVTDKAGTEANGRTEINFAIPLDSGDKYDRPLVVGKTYPIILAFAPNGVDNFNSMHQLALDTTMTIK
jgi:hypothetical protein